LASSAFACRALPFCEISHLPSLETGATALSVSMFLRRLGALGTLALVCSSCILVLFAPEWSTQDPKAQATFSQRSYAESLRPLKLPKTNSSYSAAEKTRHRLNGCTEDETCEARAQSLSCESTDMQLRCPLTCGTCKLAMLPYEERCFKKFRDEGAVQPGELHGIIRAAAKNAQWGGRLVHNDPPIVVFDNLLTSHEVNVLVEQGNAIGFRRSKNSLEGWQVRANSPQGNPVLERVAKNAVRNKPASRTSETAWCQGPPLCISCPCVANSTVHDFSERVAELTHVPVQNHEYVQLLRYDEGQYYQVHHDHISDQKNQACGGRLMTLLVYLSDVEAGGETHFPRLKDKAGKSLRVFPKKGAGLLWSNVKNDQLLVQDDLTHHEAVEVTRGQKFAANVWLHMFNFRDAQVALCAA